MGIAYLDKLLSGYRYIQDAAGAVLAQQDTVQYTGSVTVTDDAENGVTVVDVTGGGATVPAGDLGNTGATPWVEGLYGTPLDVAFSSATIHSASVDGFVPHYDYTSNTWKLGGAHVVQISAIGTGDIAGVTLKNTTASAAFGDQNSPMGVWQTEVWDGSTTVTVKSALQVKQDSAGNVYLSFRADEGAGYTETMALDLTSGQLTLRGNLAWVEGLSPVLAQNDATSVGDGRDLSIYGQQPSDGNGGGVLLYGRTGVGTDKSGGSVTIRPGGSTGSGTAGKTEIQTSAGSAALQVLGDGSIYVTGIADGVAHFASGGLVSSSTIVDADVSASANIACTKLDGDFGLGTVSAASFTGVLIGTGTPAVVGDIRLDSGATIETPSHGTGYFRDASGYQTPWLPVTTGTQTTTTSTATAIGAWTGGGFTIASGKYVRAQVILIGVRTSDHTVFVHEADLDIVNDGVTTTIECTSLAANDTTGVSPKVDTLGAAADATYAVAGSTITITVTPPASSPGTIAWTARVWLIEEASV